MPPLRGHGAQVHGQRQVHVAPARLDVGQVVIDHGAHLARSVARGRDVEPLAALLLRALGDWGERAGSDCLRAQPAARAVHDGEHVCTIR